MRLALVSAVILLSTAWVQADCMDKIPSDLLPVFLEETEHVPAWRESICAQIQAESNWNPEAESFYRPRGVPCCVGLGQIAGPTWGEEAPKVGCAGVSRKDPRCNIRVTVAYMAKLLRSSYCGRNTDQPWEIAQACYNAGLGNINRERKVCRLTYGCEEELWFENREEVCRRKPSACEETKTYVQRIQQYMDE